MASVRHLGLFPSENTCAVIGIAPDMEQLDDYNANGGVSQFSPAILRAMSKEQITSFLWRVKSWKLSTSFDWRWLYTIYEYNQTNDNYDRTARDYVQGIDSRIMENIVIGDDFSSETNLVCLLPNWYAPDSGGQFFGSVLVPPPNAIYTSAGTYSLDLQITLGFGYFDETRLVIGNSAGSSADLPTGGIPFFQRVNLQIKWLDYEFGGVIGIEGTPFGINFPEGAQTRDGPAVTPGDDFDLELTPTFLEITESSFVLEATEYWPYDPGDGFGPIYDSATGEQLRPFPS